MGRRVRWDMCASSFVAVVLTVLPHFTALVGCRNYAVFDARYPQRFRPLAVLYRRCGGLDAGGGFGVGLAVSDSGGDGHHRGQAWRRFPARPHPHRHLARRGTLRRRGVGLSAAQRLRLPGRRDGRPDPPDPVHPVLCQAAGAAAALLRQPGHRHDHRPAGPLNRQRHAVHPVLHQQFPAHADAGGGDFGYHRLLLLAADGAAGPAVPALHLAHRADVEALAGV